MATNEEEEFYEEAECPTCGATVPADANECPECGQQFAEEEEEEDLWETEEEPEEFGGEEMDEEWAEGPAPEEPSRWKLYLGVFLILFGGIGNTLMSYVHNIIGWYPFGIGGYSGYGWADQTWGASGTVVLIIGIILFYLWHRENKAYQKAQEEALEEEFIEEEPEFEEEGAMEEETWVKPEEAEDEEEYMEEPSEEEAYEDEPLEEEDEEEDDMVRCPNCGTKNEPNADVCENCGQELGGGTEIWEEE